MHSKRSNRRKIVVYVSTILGLALGDTAFAGANRTASGNLEIPITGRVHQFDRQKVEIRYLKRILIFNRSFRGFPEKIDFRPDQAIQVKFSLTDWQKFSEQLSSTPISKQTRIDLRRTLQ